MAGTSTGGAARATKTAPTKKQKDKKDAKKPENTFDLIGHKIEKTEKVEKKVVEDSEETDDPEEHFESRLLKPLPDQYFYGEMRELAEIIRREIVDKNPGVRMNAYLLTITRLD